MAFFLVRPHAVLFVAALSVPVLASGACGSRTACIEYSPAEYAASGACLSQSDALATFNNQDCPGSIVSVDGPGSFDGEICCYPVTYDSIVQSCGTGAGGSVTTGFGAGITGFGGGVTTGFGGGVTTTGTTGTDCQEILCNDAVASGMTPCGEPAIDNFDALQACAGCNFLVLDGGSACQNLCGTICSGLPVDSACANCLESSCPTQWATCQGS